MRGRVLVTCGEQRSALAITRSLGRAGFEVIVAASRVPSLAGASRHASAELPVPDPIARPEAFAAALESQAGRLEPRLLIPVTEAALLAALPIAPRIPATTIPFPDADSFAAVSDKTRVFEAARAEGIAVPREVIVGGPPDSARSGWGDLSFPVVAKPARSVAGTGPDRRKHAVVHAADPTELAAALAAMPPAAFPAHIQERILGPGIGVFLLSWGGRPLAAFSHRRIREKPPSGGVSVYRESIAPDPDLVDRSRRLLARFGWEGVAMVEYKVDAATGEAYLMEINGRFWGSLELAIASGVDFPLLLARASLGDVVDPVTDYRVGVRSRWEWGDVDHLLARLRRSATRLSLPAGAPGRLGAVRDYLAAFARGRPEVFRLSDPGPFLRETRDWFEALGHPGGAA